MSNTIHSYETVYPKPNTGVPLKNPLLTLASELAGPKFAQEKIEEQNIEEQVFEESPAGKFGELYHYKVKIVLYNSNKDTIGILYFHDDNAPLPSNFDDTDFRTGANIHFAYSRFADVVGVLGAYPPDAAVVDLISQNGDYEGMIHPTNDNTTIPVGY